MKRTLDTVRTQIGNAIKSFSSVTGCAPSDLYLGREEMALLGQDSDGGWTVQRDRVTYKGLVVNEVGQMAHVGVGFSR